tara:strand:+ start:1016 stop:1351 length:336 start_codon:yes stop_codon:yes gene_type:complete
MSIKIALLKSGEQIVADVKELASGENPVGYIFKDPEKIAISKPFLITESTEDVEDSSVEISLTSWILLTSDRELVVPTDWVVTFAEPLDSVTSMYKEKIDGKDYKVSATKK